MMKLLAVLLTVLVASCVMAADERPPVLTDAQGADQANRLAALEFLEGNWNVEQRMTPAYSDKGKDGRGCIEMHRGLDGNALVGHFEASVGDAPNVKEYEGLMVIASAHATHLKHGQPAKPVSEDLKVAAPKFVTFWADSEGNVLVSHDVAFDNQKFTATFDKHGEHPKSRVVFEKTPAGTLTYAMEHETAKGWEQVATGTYTRAEVEAREVKEAVPSK